MQFTAKTVDEAKAVGLAQMGLTEDQADIKVLEEPKKGLFGRLKGQAVVEITEKKKEVKEEPKKEQKENETSEKDEQRALEFVKGIIEIMDLSAKAELSTKDGSTVITLISDDSANVIGYRGEVLDAIQTLAGAAMNIGNKDYKKVVVDCENYREKREDTLVKLAKKLEEKATEMKREVILEPMSPYERRIIHTALSESQTVTTKSEGKEPNRYVVIVPNDKDEFSKPYNAGRNHSDRGGRNGGKGGRQGHGRKDNRSRNSHGGRSSGGSAKKKTTITFGTYLGNSLKDKE
jgi:spoIIIJ-associated protein